MRPSPALAQRALAQRAMTSFLRATVRPTLRAKYRFRARQLEHVPVGPALLVSNHVSFIDWLLVAAALPRVPRFVMHQHHFLNPALRWFFELYDVIPIAPRKEDPARLAAAMDAIDDALARGELVAIWPEGQMTPDGELSALRPGVERIVARRPVPVVPMAVRGMWGSSFSREGGEPLTKLPRLVRRNVELVAGPPIPPGEVCLEVVRARIAELRGAVR